VPFNSGDDYIKVYNDNYEMCDSKNKLKTYLVGLAFDIHTQ